MSFFRALFKSAETPKPENKEVVVQDRWSVPPRDEYQIIDGIVELLSMLEADVPQPHDDADGKWQVNREIIQYAKRVILDAAIRMKKAETEGLGEALHVLDDFKLKKEQYVNDMKMLGEKFKDLYLDRQQMTLDHARRWRVLGVWLWALHDVTANAKKSFQKDEHGFVKSLDDGTYPHIGPKDKFFKGRTEGVSKYTLIIHYGIASKHIDAVLAREYGSVAALDELCKQQLNAQAGLPMSEPQAAEPHVEEVKQAETDDRVGPSLG